jgi:NADH-quinone oxidoreductase subunit L
MRYPLVILAVASVVGGLIDLPFGKLKFLDVWLSHVASGQGDLATQSGALRASLLATTTVVALVGIAIAWSLWSRRVDRPGLEPALLQRHYYVDDLSSALFSGAGGALSRALATVVDNRVIDGLVNGVGTAARGLGGVVRRLQTGYVRNYALGIAAGTVLILGFMLARAGS